MKTNTFDIVVIGGSLGADTNIAEATMVNWPQNDYFGRRVPGRRARSV